MLLKNKENKLSERLRPGKVSQYVFYRHGCHASVLLCQSGEMTAACATAGGADWKAGH